MLTSSSTINLSLLVDLQRYVLGGVYTILN